MKRQHAALSYESPHDDLGNLSVVKRIAAQDELHQLLHPASLLRLDLDSLAEVLAYIDLASFVLLCQTSSHRVASVLTSCTKSLCFNDAVYCNKLLVKDAALKSLLTMISGRRVSRLKSLSLSMSWVDFKLCRL
jgi:hypothetical protein